MAHGICSRCREDKQLAVLGGPPTWGVICVGCARPADLTPLSPAQLGEIAQYYAHYNAPSWTGLVGPPRPGGEFTGKPQEAK